jgi:hypothetical protein
MSNTDFSEQWKSMQQMFLLNFHHSESMRENARRFWENQNKILDNMEAFTSNWFKRRHTGTYSAQEAAQRMCGTESMVDVVQAYQDWAKGAFERLMADGLACHEQIVAATGALTSPPLSPSEKGTEPARVEACGQRSREICLTNIVPVVSARDLQFVGTDADLCCLSASDRRPSDMCTTDNW